MISKEVKTVGVGYGILRERWEVTTWRVFGIPVFRIKVQIR